MTIQEEKISRRSKKNITLNELADRTGLTMSYLSKIEWSKKVPQHSMVSKIAMALEVEVTYLLSANLEYSSDIRLSFTKKDKGKIVKTLGSSYGYKYEALVLPSLAEICSLTSSEPP